MAVALLQDSLWDLVEPFLPIPPRRPKGGRPRVSSRACLTGIVFVLRSGIPWRMLPQELGCGSGMTCWRRLRDWQQAGVWESQIYSAGPIGLTGCGQSERRATQVGAVVAISSAFERRVT